ncbi:unnamed protein product [Victoria cruziana]
MFFPSILHSLGDSRVRGLWSLRGGRLQHYNRFVVERTQPAVYAAICRCKEGGISSPSPLQHHSMLDLPVGEYLKQM